MPVLGREKVKEMVGYIKKIIFGHFSDFLAILFSENQPFLCQFLPQPKNLLSPLIVLGIEVWSEFRQSWTKNKGSCPLVALLPKMAKIWDES